VKREFKPGDWVVYRKQKFSVHPGQNARGIHPAPHGDGYNYEVEKFWTVVAAQPDEKIVVRTRRGKQLTLSVHDPALRPARWWERLLFRQRFPALNSADLTSGNASS
jgi:hypothetical protein